MIKLTFDSLGYLVPYTLISIDLAVFEREFVLNFPNSTSRNQLFKGYIKYLSDFQQKIVPHFNQWIDGSFVTKKVNPNDIDIVTFIDYSIFEEKE